MDRWTLSRNLLLGLSAAALAACASQSGSRGFQDGSQRDFRDDPFLHDPAHRHHGHHGHHGHDGARAEPRQRDDEASLGEVVSPLAEEGDSAGAGDGSAALRVGGDDRGDGASASASAALAGSDVPERLTAEERRARERRDEREALLRERRGLRDRGGVSVPGLPLPTGGASRGLGL